MMADGTLTHDDALMMLADHVGKEVSVWLTMEDAERFWTVLPPMMGVLGKRTLGVSDGNVEHETIERVKRTIDPMYTVGDQSLALPSLPGIVRRYEMGLEWVLAEGLTLRINWGGDA
jgi:hypothetical protein